MANHWDEPNVYDCFGLLLIRICSTLSNDQISNHKSTEIIKYSLCNSLETCVSKFILEVLDKIGRFLTRCLQLKLFVVKCTLFVCSDNGIFILWMYKYLFEIESQICGALKLSASIELNGLNSLKSRPLLLDKRHVIESRENAFDFMIRWHMYSLIWTPANDWKTLRKRKIMQTNRILFLPIFLFISVTTDKYRR